jgi:peptidoglycan/LPS O-acetylase OafA/YrhL
VRTRLPAFLWRRALRILPAFWCVLVVTAFGLAPLAAMLEGHGYNFGSALGYVTDNFWLRMNQTGISGTLTDVPFPNTWNGALWTLMYEGLAYLAVALIFLVPWARRHLRIVAPVLFVAATVALPLAEGPLGVTTTLYLKAFELAGYFTAGMLVYAFRDLVTVEPWVPFFAVAALTALATVGWGSYLLPLPIALLALWLGAVLPLRAPGGLDLSYGIYIWAFPMQQLVVLCGLAWLGPWVTALIAFGVTLPLAFGSWKLIEEPALRLRHLPRRATRETPDARRREPAPALAAR